MTLTVGRCVLPDPSNVDASGDFLSLSGVYYSTATTAANRAAEAQARSAQLTGMVDNPDEDVFPLVWTSEAMYDGFYAVEDASWSWLNDGSSRAAVAAWSLTLRRVTDGNAPLVEIAWTAIRRKNYHSIAPAAHYVRRRRDQPGWQSRGTGWTDAARPTSDGFDLYAMSNSVNQTNTAAHLGVADEHYPAAASIEVKGADGTWYPWTGREVSAAAADVRVTNGVVRFGVTSTGTVRHELWDGTAWDTFDFGVSVSPLSPSYYDCDLWSEPTILRNSLDTVVLRYDARPTSDADYETLAGSASVTVTLLAGELWAGLGVITPGINTYVTVAAATTTASTAITGGLRATSNNANGNRYVIACPTSFTTGLADGSLSPAAVANANAVQFMVAQSLGGSSATGRNTEANIIQDYIATANVRTRIVAR